MDLEIRFPASLRQRFEEVLAINSIVEDVLPTIPTAQEVAD
jgi:hypothetical protein